MEEIISFQNIIVEPYEVEHILDVHMEQQINEHSTLYLKAVLSEEKKDGYAKKNNLGSYITLKYKKNSRTDSILFHGMVRNLEVNAINGSYYLEVYAISYSYLLDVKKTSRTFQNKQMSYTSLVQQVMGEYGSFSTKDVVSNGRSIGQLIVQYKETDWEFLKRLASHFHTGLVSDSTVEQHQCYFGIPNNGTHSLDVNNYSMKQDLGRYLELSKNGNSGLMEQDFVYYYVVTKLPVHIGDTISFQGRSLSVYQIKAYMEKGEFLYHVTLATKKGMAQPYIWHDRIAGCSLDAKIIEIKNDQVKVSVQIDVDLGHSPGSPCFFPYSTIYSSQDGSGWYCMPEMGDNVRLYFPDSVEEHSYAISSVHEAVDLSLQKNASSQQSSSSQQGSGGGNHPYSGQRDDPSVKSLRNQDGKEIRLTPEGVYIISGGTVITLTDEGGVSIVSDQDIAFKSDKNITLDAEENVYIVGQTGIDLSCNETASIRMKENVEVIGQEVKAN